MKKIILLTCIYLGVWGFAGFLFTLLAGFLICCANLPKSVFFFTLSIFGVLALIATALGVTRVCKKHEKLNW